MNVIRLKKSKQVRISCLFKKSLAVIFWFSNSTSNEGILRWESRPSRTLVLRKRAICIQSEKLGFFSSGRQVRRFPCGSGRIKSGGFNNESGIRILCCISDLWPWFIQTQVKCGSWSDPWVRNLKTINGRGICNDIFIIFCFFSLLALGSAGAVEEIAGMGGGWL
jgi:hypothetical protein